MDFESDKLDYVVIQSSIFGFIFGENDINVYFLFVGSVEFFISFNNLYKFLSSLVFSIDE